MRYLQYILYGVIVGRWLIGIKERISQSKNLGSKNRGRYVVIGMNSGKEEFILVGQTGDRVKAKDAANFVDENTLFYIPICYDMLDPNDRVEFGSRPYCTHIEKEDEYWIRKARSML